MGRVDAPSTAYGGPLPCFTGEDQERLCPGGTPLLASLCRWRGKLRYLPRKGGGGCVGIVLRLTSTPAPAAMS